MYEDVSPPPSIILTSIMFWRCHRHCPLKKIHDKRKSKMGLITLFEYPLFVFGDLQFSIKLLSAIITEKTLPIRLNLKPYLCNQINQIIKKMTLSRAVASSIIGGGADIHIYVFTHHKNNRFQKKLIVQNTNI